MKPPVLVLQATPRRNLYINRDQVGAVVGVQTFSVDKGLSGNWPESWWPRTNLTTLA